jgi:uncharacterized membrane protein YphA (DoxX/SURF4 family)
MLNLFPELSFLSLITPTLVRVTVGVFFITLGYSKFTHDKYALIDYIDSLKIKNARNFVQILGITEIALGILLFIGMFTQISAIIGSIIMLVSLFIANKTPGFKAKTQTEYLFAFVMTFTLIITGAGFLAIDLPL